MPSIHRDLQHRHWHWPHFIWMNPRTSTGFMSQPFFFFLDKCSLSIRVYQGRQEAQLDLSAAVPLDGTCQLSPRGYSQLCIFCRERYLSRFLLSFISLPYFPTVPSSDRIKWECMQLSVVSLLRGFPRVWYRHTTCKIVRTRVRVPSWPDCSKGLFVHYRAPVHAKSTTSDWEQCLSGSLQWSLNLSSFTLYFSMDGYAVHDKSAACAPLDLWHKFNDTRTHSNMRTLSICLDSQHCHIAKNASKYLFSISLLTLSQIIEKTVQGSALIHRTHQYSEAMPLNRSISE